MSTEAPPRIGTIDFTRQMGGAVADRNPAVTAPDGGARHPTRSANF